MNIIVYKKRYFQVSRSTVQNRPCPSFNISPWPIQRVVPSEMSLYGVIFIFTIIVHSTCYYYDSNALFRCVPTAADRPDVMSVSAGFTCWNTETCPPLWIPCGTRKRIDFAITFLFSAKTFSGSESAPNVSFNITNDRKFDAAGWLRFQVAFTQY